RALEDEYPRVFDATRYEISEIDNVSGPSDLTDPRLYFSNELLDAFPVHRITNSGELYVTLDPENNFTWTTGPFSVPLLADLSLKVAEGQIIEVNLEVDDWFAGVAARINSGYVITVDYGAEEAELYDPLLRPNGTLRAFSRHKFVDDVLSAPGEYDITSSVNWTQVKRAGERWGFEVVEFASQDKFLLNAGLLEELAERITRMETDADKFALTTDAREMILPGGMASSFQVLVQRRS